MRSPVKKNLEELWGEMTHGQRKHLAAHFTKTAAAHIGISAAHRALASCEQGKMGKASHADYNEDTALAHDSIATHHEDAAGTCVECAERLIAESEENSPETHADSFKARQFSAAEESDLLEKMFSATSTAPLGILIVPGEQASPESREPLDWGN